MTEDRRPRKRSKTSSTLSNDINNDFEGTYRKLEEQQAAFDCGTSWRNICRYTQEEMKESCIELNLSTKGKNDIIRGNQQSNLWLFLPYDDPYL
jgi:hypothetical protein